MEVYPHEVTSPPVPLVALLGRPDLHILVGDYLRMQHVPRILSIGIPDPLQAAAKFGEKIPKAPGSSQAGILKANWLQKQRGQRPAVAVLLVGRQNVTGDPASWTRMVAQIEAVKGAVRPRGARLLVVVVQSPGEGPLPDDRIGMICRQAGIDKKCLLTLVPGEGAASLAALGRAVQEQCGAYYSAEAQRRLAVHATRVGAQPLAATQLKVAFQLGVLAEFRGDWAAAVHMYQEAYGYVSQVSVSGANPLQRFCELRAVAELVHVKLVSVLLLALKQCEEALSQLDRHLRFFRWPQPIAAPDAPPGLVGAHHAWVCRQYMVMAELLSTSGIDLTKLKREQQPGELYLSAAKEAIQRRKVADFIRGVQGPGDLSHLLPGQVVPGQYVGQVALADPPRRLTDPEYTAYLEVEECRTPHSRHTIDLLRAAHEGLLRGGAGALSAPTLSSGQGSVPSSPGGVRRAPATKSLHHISLLMGQEMVEGGDLRGGRALLEEVAAYYRRTGWAVPLFQSLMALRECAHRMGQVKEHAALSLEAASLEGGPLDVAQRAAIAGTALMTLLDPPPEALGPLEAGAETGAVVQLGGDSTSTSPRSPGSPSSPVAMGAPGVSGQPRGGSPGLHYVAEAEGPGWGSVVRVVAGTLPSQQQHRQQQQPEQGGPQAAGDNGMEAGEGEGGCVCFGVALWSCLPVELPLLGAELILRDEHGTFSTPLLDASPNAAAAAASGAAAAAAAGSAPAGLAAEGPTTAGTAAAAAAGPGVGREGLPEVPELSPGAWRRFTAAVPLRCSGVLTATWVQLTLGPSASVAFRLAGAPGGGPGSDVAAAATAAAAARAPWAADSVLPPFPAASGFQQGRYAVEVPPRHTPPTLSISAPVVGLEGEALRVRLEVAAPARGALSGARLVVKALHRESQQYVPLRLLAAHPSAAGPAGSPRTVQHHVLRAEEGVLVGDVPAAAVHAVEVEARPEQRGGQLDVRAQLQYTCHPPGGAKPEVGKSVVGSVIPLESPFRFDLGLVGAPRTHTLLQPPALAARALPTSASELGRQMQGLDVQDSMLSVSTDRSTPTALDSGASASALGLGQQQPQHSQQGAGGPAGLSAVVAGGGSRGGGPLVLPAGQRSTAVVCLRNHAPCQVCILSVELRPPQPSPAEPASDQALPLSITPAAPPALPGGGTPAASSGGGEGVLLHKGDTHSSLFSLSCPAPGQAPSLGTLVVRWRRAEAPAQQRHWVRGAHKAQAPPGALADEGAEEQQAAGEVLESSSVLPAVSFLPPMLSATLSYPPGATAGAPATVRLAVSNSSGGGGVEASVSIKEAHGFVVAGPKATSLHILPGTTDALAWQFVPTHSGMLRLPSIVLEAPALGYSLEPSRGCTLFVEPAPIDLASLG